MQVSLDRLIGAVLSVSDLKKSEKAFIFLDEITYAKDWDLWLKTFFDENWPVHIAGSSSSTVAKRHRRPESGVGRWEEQYLAPYLFREYLDLVGHPVAIPVTDRLAKTIHECLRSNIEVGDLGDHRRRFLLTGGFPELLMAIKDEPKNFSEGSLLLQSQRTLRTDAIERAIYKDIPQAFGVDSPMMLERMLYTLAGQVTGILSPNTICSGLDGLSHATFDRYLSYLEQSFLVFRLANYSGSEFSKQRRGRKLYFVDGAVRNAALQRGLAPLADVGEMGLLIENLAAGHLHALSEQSQVRVYYWRDGNDEVDLIYDHPDSPIAFEIASSASHKSTGLFALIDRHPKFKGSTYLVAPNAPRRRASDSPSGVGTIPLDLFLLAVSAQAQEALENRLHARPVSALFPGIPLPAIGQDQ